MTINMKLYNPKLEFIHLGTAKVHARWNGTTSSMPAVDISHFTMCGRSFSDEMKPMSEREIDVQKLCGRCYSSLRTYGPQVMLVREEVEA